VNFSISPNPANDFLKVKIFEKIIGKISITDIQGKQVLEERINEDQNLSLFVGNLLHASYIVTI
jgi:hypothetical protein